MSFRGFACIHLCVDTLMSAGCMIMDHLEESEMKVASGFRGVAFIKIVQSWGFYLYSTKSRITHPIMAVSND